MACYFACKNQMAEEVLKKIEEGLNCSICLDTYTDPKLLQCFHVYCRQCLVPLVDRDQQGKLGLTCPICRQVTPIPNRGVAGLQPAFHINHLLEIQDSVKKLDNPVTALEGAVGGATIAEPSVDVVKHVCFEHPGEEVKLYCETCGELVCYECGLIEGKHHSHQYKKLDQAFQEYKEEITSFMEPMEKQVAIATKALAQLDTNCGEISDQRAATKDNLHITFRRLQDALDVRETELISQLDQKTQGKLKVLAAQKDQIEIILAQLNSCLHFMRESLRTENWEDMLMMKRNTVQQVKELTTPFPQDSLEPSTEADIEFSTLTDLMNMCRYYGQIVISSSPDPSRCYAVGRGVKAGAVGEESTFILHAFDLKGKRCKWQIESLDCELLSKIAGTRASGIAERKEQSQYKFSYQPTVKGRHQLNVKVNGQHIKGSPFSVAVKSCVDTPPILTMCGLDGPLAVAITQGGEVVVTERGAHCMSVLSLSGQRLRFFGTHGSGHGQFDCPNGIAVDGGGNILVADCSNHRIQRFTAEGQFLAAVGTEGSGRLQFSSPRDIAFSSSNGKVYVADRNNDRVQVLNSDLTFFSTFGKRGSGVGQFNCPCGIACDSTGKVYVVDYENKRIQGFTAEGKFLRILESGKLNSPNSIAIGPNDMVFISEHRRGNSCVSVFSSQGHFMTSFGNKLQWPLGLAVDATGLVYVCDVSNNRIQVF